jgi:chorismate mutase
MTGGDDMSATEILDGLRGELDAIDARLMDALAQRFAVCRKIAEVKKRHGIPMMQPQRIDYVRQRCAALGAARGLDEPFVLKLYALIIEEACNQEDAILGG